MSRLQYVQNEAARLVSGTRRYENITPVLQELHWLPVRRREYQDGHPGLPVTVRHSSSLSGRRVSVGLRRKSSTAAFCCNTLLSFWNLGLNSDSADLLSRSLKGEFVSSVQLEGN